METTVEVETRVCSACKKELPLDAFTKDRRRKSGINGRCKDCKKEQDWRRNGQGLPDREWEKADLQVLSLGAGVQSSTLLLMSCLGELPKLDAAIFADAGWEPEPVYRWLDEVLKPAAEEAGIPLIVRSAGSIQEDMNLTTERFGEPGQKRDFIVIPAFIKRKDDKGVGMMKRHCTKQFKVIPVGSELFRLSNHGAKTVDQWFGISIDEIERMHKATERQLYVRNVYPLVDLNMTREQCQRWLLDHGYPRAPRSSCLGCPFHSDKAWAQIKEDKDAFESVVKFERRMQDSIENAFLHRSCKPIDQVEFGDLPEQGEDCAGYCWT